MVQAGHNRYTGPYTGDEPIVNTEPRKISRRNLLVGAGAASLTAVVGGGAAIKHGTSGQHENASSGNMLTASPTSEVALSRFNITAPEADDIVQHVVLPDYYVNRPWAKPENYFGKTPEEIKADFTMRATPETSTDEGFVSEWGQKAEAIANIGKSLLDARHARELHYRVAETDRYGQPFGDMYKYINDTYMNSAFEGLLAENAPDSNVTAFLKKFFLRYSRDFERALTDEERRGIGTTFVSAELGGPESVSAVADPKYLEPVPGYERKLYINLTTWLPPVEAAIPKRDMYKGVIIVNANEDKASETYRLFAQYIELNQQ